LSDVDFDRLARDAAAAGGSLEAMNALWAAAFSLDEWLFLARGALPDVRPYVASNPSVAGGAPMLKAFTDGTKLQRFARENGLTGPGGDAPMLAIPGAKALSFVEQFSAAGVVGLHFNADHESDGFFGPLAQLSVIKQHLDEHVFPKRAGAAHGATARSVERIADFHRTLVLPAFEEIERSPRMAAKGRTLRHVFALETGDPTTDDALAMLHSKRRSLVALPRTPEAEQAGEWVGPTLIIAEAAATRAALGHPQAGIYYSSVLFRITEAGRIFVSPFVFFWMRFDDKMHGFAHRYDNDIADHPIEDVTRAQIINHALGSITFFDMHAMSTTKPW
jgi:hypothetical protein